MSNSTSNSINNNDKAVVVYGAGDAIGGAVLREFAKEGYKVVGVRRNGEKLQGLVDEINQAGGEAYGWSGDARSEEEVVETFNKIENEIAPIEVAVFNIGANVGMNLRETTARKFYKIWEMACFGGFLVGREAVTHMVKRNRGTVIFTGATASIRAKGHLAAFSSAKFGLRAVSQSMAREFGEQGIHVCHVIIDGAVDTEWIWENFLSKVPEDQRRPDDIMSPESIAKAYVGLHNQPRDTWTWEMDLRPWCEKLGQ